MSSDLIPAGDSGEFVVDDDQLMDHDPQELRLFEARLLNEARLRGLVIETTPRQYGTRRETVIRWRPATLAE